MRAFSPLAQRTAKKLLTDTEDASLSTAIELEGLAAAADPDRAYPFAVESPGRGEPLQIDTRQLIAAVAGDARRGDSASRIARRFHSTMVEMISQVCARLRKQTGLNSVALSGGVFMNALLLSETVQRLSDEHALFGLVRPLIQDDLFRRIDRVGEEPLPHLCVLLGASFELDDSFQLSTPGLRGADVFLDEPITLPQIAGAILVLGGIAAISLRK